ncbi:MAG TPA: nitrilase [Methanocorpusculum sp.]|nr:nitrilase [Methanocorpusculum sp.]
MKICCAQVAQVWDNPDEMFARADAVLSGVECADADMVLFCEQYACGWRAEVPQFGDEIKEAWRALAKKHAKCIIGSFARANPAGGRPHNTMLVCGPSGEVLAEYDKIHLFTPGGENKGFCAGRAPVVFAYQGVKFGCSVCFDLRFPELYRDYLRAGAEVMLVQAAWAAARAADWELLLRARALENRCYVAACGALGFDAATNTECAGKSMICDMEGRVIADCGVFEGVCAAEIDAESVGEWREKWGMDAA